ncbi:MAG TPA: hypothetical protein VMK83_07350 [Gaiellaceae bacterium]|nr:hypothetical protein [Gaiellaceae bacterium]
MNARRNSFALAAPSIGVAALVLATLVALIGSAQAAPSTKPYVATFETPVAAGTSDTVDLELENRASQQVIGSANVTAQAGFSITGAYIDGAGDVKEAFPTTLLELRNLDIAPGTSRTITIDVTTPCSTDAADKWGIRAKQSNDFKGPPGNDFSLVEADSNLHTAVGGAGGTPAELVFTEQPGDAVKQQTLGSPEVKVAVVDTCGNPTNPSGNVTVTLVQPQDTTYGGGGDLAGTNPQPVSASGVASFNDLTVSESGFGYVLRASYPGVLAADSDAFDVYDAFCPPCTASGVDTHVDVEALGGTAGLSVGAANTAECGTLTPLGSTFAIVPLSGTTGTYTAVLTIDKPALQGVGVSNIVVCVSETSDGPLQRLQTCAKKNPTPKCIVSQTSSHAGDAVITMLFDGDPFGGGFG